MTSSSSTLGLMYQPYIMGSTSNSHSHARRPSQASRSTSTRIHPPPLPSSSHHHENAYQTYLYPGSGTSTGVGQRVHPPPLNPDIYTSNGVQYLPPSEPNTWSGDPSVGHGADTHTHTHTDGDFNYPPTYLPGFQNHFDPHPNLDEEEDHRHPHGHPPLGGMTMNTFLTPSHHSHGQAYEEGEEEISPSQPDRIMVEKDVNLPIDHELDNDDDVDLEGDGGVEEGDGDEPYFPTAKAKKAARKGKGKAAAPVKIKSKSKGKGKGKAKAISMSKSQKVKASAMPRTTIRGEPKHAITPSTHSHSHIASGSNTPSTLTPALAPTTVVGAYDSDSHINTSYFPGLRNVIYPLIAAPIGTFLDVNDLLILHPPALSASDDTHIPVNQYNRMVEDKGLSKFEMYTCRACRKTYDGKNARSVARRHLQDKHGIPLSQQARRTRWDVEGNRPVDAADAQERSRKCKRDWAKVTRQQRSLEKLHGDFLTKFGPTGLQTSWKHPLIAPAFRDSNALDLGPNEVGWKTADQVEIPESIIQSALLLTELEEQIEKGEHAPSINFESLLDLDQVPGPSNALGLRVSITSNGSFLSQPTSPFRPHFHPYTSTPVSAPHGLDQQTNQNEQELYQHGPVNQTYETYPYPPHRDANGSPIILSHPMSNADDYALRMYPEPNDPARPDETTDEEDPDAPGPLWVRPGWQEWHEFPSTSSSDLRAIGIALAAAEHEAETEVPVVEAEQGERMLVEEGGEDADLAAESLLDLHSTPLRGDEARSRSVTPEPVEEALIAQARLEIEAEQAMAQNTSNVRASPATQAPWYNGISSLVAHYASSSQSSRPAYTRHESHSGSSKSKQPFLSRPAHMQRSLSTTILLDDPFVLDPSRDNTPTSRPRAHTSARFLAPNSPTIHRSKDKDGKRKFPSGSPLAPSRSARAPLDGIHPNQSGSTSRLQNLDTQAPTLSGPLAASPKKATFQTPLRPSRSKGSGHPPSSVGWMQFSSPADPAASLGLVPMHAVPTTPGISMIIGQDTPVVVGGKRRRAAVGGGGATPSVR